MSRDADEYTSHLYLTWTHHPIWEGISACSRHRKNSKLELRLARTRVYVFCPKQKSDSRSRSRDRDASHTNNNNNKPFTCPPDKGCARRPLSCISLKSRILAIPPWSRCDRVIRREINKKKSNLKSTREAFVLHRHLIKQRYYRYNTINKCQLNGTIYK